MKIALIHKGQAYKPEIQAYLNFFKRIGHECTLFKEIRPELLQGFDLEWHFVGVDHIPRAEGRIKVHEYTSLSIPPLPRWKNQLKKWWNPKPDLRIFQTPSVKEQFRFKDDTPFLFRGPGLGAHFQERSPDTKKEFDFVYLGAMEPARKNRGLSVEYSA